MKRVNVCTCFMYERVKLTPQGKWYHVHTLTKERGKLEIELHDSKGKPKLVSYITSVYRNARKYE